MVVVVVVRLTFEWQLNWPFRNYIQSNHVQMDRWILWCVLSPLGLAFCQYTVSFCLSRDHCIILYWPFLTSAFQLSGHHCLHSFLLTQLESNGTQPYTKDVSGGVGRQTMDSEKERAFWNGSIHCPQGNAPSASLWCEKKNGLCHEGSGRNIKWKMDEESSHPKVL